MSRTLSRDEYIATMEQNFHAAKEDIIARIRSLPKRIFVAMATARFDRSTEQGRPDHIDLDGRRWPLEIQEEIVDGIAYDCIHIRRESR